MKKNIYVLCGGKSVEHEVSLKSASAIVNAIDREKYDVYPIYITYDGVWCNLGLWEKKIENPEELKNPCERTLKNSIGDFLSNDLKENSIVFPALHGPNGEDGTIQGMLEMLNIPYVGNEVLSSALCMDKSLTKDVLEKHNIPQVKHLSFKEYTWNTDKDNMIRKIELELNYPLYIKPSRGGSSVGINRTENKEELEKAIKEAFRYDGKILVEEEAKAREMQTSVVGNEDPKASLPGEFIMERAFFDYNAKYIDGKLITVIPAKLTSEVTKHVREIAVKTFKALDCNGLARVDIFVTDDNEVLVNEINTMPGFTPLSMTPALWTATDGTTYEELIEILIGLGFDRYKEKSKIINRR